MKRILFATFSLLAAIAVYATSSWQDAAPNSMRVDYDAIKKFVNEKPTEYQELFERFVSADTTLTLEEVAIVYYGNRVKPLIYPGGNPEARNYSVRKLNSEEKWIEALEASDAKNLVVPTELRTQWDGTVAAYSIKDQWRLLPYFIRYRQLVNVIIASGDGKSTETAFKVVNVDDESVVMIQSLGITSIGTQALIYVNNVPFDKITAKAGDEEKTIFFDITLWFEYLAKALAN